MQNVSSTILLFLIVTLLFSCHCKTCTDNLTEINKKIIYNNKDVIAFKNDTLGVIYDTITVIKGNIANTQYDCVPSSGDALKNDCKSVSEIDYSNKFTLYIYQQPNYLGNVITYVPEMPHNWESKETVSYNYKNEMINAFHINNTIDSLGSYSWKGKDSSFVFYNDYYYTVDKSIMLLQYTKVFKDGKRRVYRLQ